MTETEADMLTLAGQQFRYAGARETAIREQFGVSETRYWQMVDRLLDRPDALAWDAVLVRRLVRLREARRQMRSARRLREVS